MGGVGVPICPPLMEDKSLIYICRIKFYCCISAEKLFVQIRGILNKPSGISIQILQCQFSAQGEGGTKKSTLKGTCPLISDPTPTALIGDKKQILNFFYKYSIQTRVLKKSFISGGRTSPLIGDISPAKPIFITPSLTILNI